MSAASNIMGKINLRISTRMSEKGENEIIRFSLAARKNFKLEKRIINVAKGNFTYPLKIKSLYREDLSRLARLVKAGKMQEADTLRTGFVSRSTFQKIVSKAGEDIWLSSHLNPLMVGADPEFGLINPKNGILQRAELILPNSKKFPFGADGPGCELRPDPSNNHIQVVENMLSILQAAPEAAEPLKWVGGATFDDSQRTYWFGGHIHLGRPELPRKVSKNMAFHCLATVLDHLVAMPFLKIDFPNPHKRRLGCPHAYGLASGIRTKDNLNRFEYRVLSGLWAVHPTLSRIAIGVTKAIAEAFYKIFSQREYNQDFLLTTAGSGDSPATKHFGLDICQNKVAKIINYAAPQSFTAKLEDNWIQAIRKLPNHDEYEEEIEAFISLVKSDPKDISLDLKENWLQGRELTKVKTPELSQNLARVENK